MRFGSTRDLDLGIPVLGICYGHQVIADSLGGTVERTDTAEFGRTDRCRSDRIAVLGLPAAHEVWMSHRDAVVHATGRGSVSPRPHRVRR
jgi:GMP synthase (glutamine-hydrolysing)